MNIVIIALSFVILLLLMYCIMVVISLKFMNSFIQWKYIKDMNGNKDFASKKLQSDFDLYKQVSSGRDLIKNKLK